VPKQAGLGTCRPCSWMSASEQEGVERRGFVCVCVYVCLCVCERERVRETERQSERDKFIDNQIDD
jgi:hypothetical protein